MLTAVDAALMVIDAAKGVEARTIKLFEVCRLRDTPIITFVNKLDREGREPLELLDEVEAELALDMRADHLADRHRSAFAAAITWRPTKCAVPTRKSIRSRSTVRKRSPIDCRKTSRRHSSMSSRLPARPAGRTIRKVSSKAI